jgi:hypothetical protein
MKLNFSVFLNSYNDSCQTSTPQLNNFRWERDIYGIPFTQENSQMLVVQPNATVTLLASDNKSFIYIDTDQSLSMIYNGGSAIVVNPFNVNGKLQPGVFFLSGTVNSVSITNTSAVAANVFFACMG